MLKIIRFLLLCLVALIVVMALLTNPRPHRAAAITAYAHQLFEFGAVRYVHALRSDRITMHQDLFDRVAAGAALSAQDSCTYRTAYWMVLQDNARRFQFVDDDLHMATDYGMDHSNNCAGLGIAGAHDLHDISARQNFDELVAHLDALEAGAGWMRSVFLINEINKNLIDLTVHFAPATHAIGVQDPAFLAQGRLATPYNNMQAAFKNAQFAPVNSPAYWTAVDDALAAYATIVMAAQDVTTASSSGLQRRLSGRWLSLQTVAPRLDLTDCTRPRPDAVAPECG